MVKIIFVLLSLFLWSMSFAQPQYYKDLGAGYYQYKNEDIDNKTSVKKHIVPPDEVLYSMPAEEFQKLYTATLNHTLTERTIENYSEYARMTRMVEIRANEFASLQMLHAQLNPANTNNFDRSGVREKDIEIAITRVLVENKTEYGFLYFYSPTCSYCRKQDPLLKMFQNRYGWEVESINIEEKPHLKEQFDITVTPAIRLVSRNHDVMPISNGLISLPDMEEHSYRLIRYLKGETTDLNFSEPLNQ